jgi:septum formation protein
MDFPIISKADPLYLASASARRRRLLEQLRLPFRSRRSDIEEDMSGDAPSFGTLRLAEEKAESILPLPRPGWVLGADTVVVLTERSWGNQKVITKPYARSLSGREHRVITGFASLILLERLAM